MDSYVNEFHQGGTIEDALCQWYIPTVPQTPKALGVSGIVLWVIGSLITVILFAMFIKQSYFLYRHTDRSFSRHLFGVTSMYVVMALMTSIGTIIPRAHEICSAVKDIYMSQGISHFIGLTIAMYGGEKNMASHVEGKQIKIRQMIICRCCFCIPNFNATRANVKILKWITFQMKWTQAGYHLLRVLIKTAQEDSIGLVPPGSNMAYLNILNIISFLPGVISLVCIGSLVVNDLEPSYQYTRKGRLVRLTIVITKLQRLVFELLDLFGVFPCYPPLVSTKFYKDVIKDFIYLLEVFILGTLTFHEYSRGETFSSPSTFRFKKRSDAPVEEFTSSTYSSNEVLA